MMHIFSQQNTSRGYTLLFAVLVSSLVLGVGISILNIAKKEFLIATATRDSAAAFYAADGGLECAIYADTTSESPFTVASTLTEAERSQRFNSKCFVPNGGVAGSAVGDGKQGTFTFHAKFGGEGSSCAVVTISKLIDNSTGEERIRTTIESRGYNTGWNGNGATGLCDLGSAKRVERAVRYSRI